jgi:transcription-repair coupling factor (superfamily II helicase)
MKELNKDFFKDNTERKINNVGINTQPYLLKELCANVSTQDVMFVVKNRVEGRKVLNTLQFLIDREVLFFPEWDSAPYENISPSQSLLHERMKTLFQLISSSGSKIIITTVRAALQLIPTRAMLASKVFSLKVGQSIKREELIKNLIELGYSRVSFVTTPGEFSIRGGIVDIASGEAGFGYRVDSFGDEVESIKVFDIASQVTSESKTSVNIFPPSELIISDETIASFENYLLSTIGARYKENQMLSSIHDQIKPVGVENFLPAFYSKLSSVFDYLKEPVIVLDNFAKIETKKFIDKVKTIYERKVDDKPEVLPPDEAWLSIKKFERVLESSTVIEFSPFKESGALSSDIDSVPAFHQRSSPFEMLKNFIDEQKKLSKCVIVSCLSEGSRERIVKMLSDHGVTAVKANSWPTERGVHVLVSPIEYGAVCSEHAVVTEEDLFGEKIKTARPKKKISGGIISTEQGFQLGEVVVHKEYGIGRFDGLELVKLSNSQHDCLKIIYAGDDKLFVPVENMDVLVRYGSSSDSITLDSLERTRWQLKKAKAKKKIRAIAKYLLDIAAERNVEQAEKITAMTGAYDEFCSAFPYVETEDQEATINAVLEDLGSGKPMDRLVCGDTGVGKTEVAIRAAFVTTMSQAERSQKKLVTLICPTTLLCRQHYKVFKERFKNLNVNIVQLSRLVSDKEKKRVVAEINAGKVDIVIGTHALFADKIDYKNLALLIVDEEHHFGVSHKEKLKKLKKNIHVLTLSATPIPRTLQMSLAGIRELNLIATQPINRIATKISVAAFDTALVKEALIRERSRGGQSFYTCPRISDLSVVEESLRKILPKFKIVKAHGRMPVNELDKIMEKFYEGKFDVLLSTSIIESGLDVPKANTIIIHNSDRFGLAQLYQLKGRVGRSNVESYAYFTVKENKALTQATLKKLNVLQNLDELGAGFSISSYDMDIRGFGNLLGEEQSGHIKEIGVELYQQMLQETLSELKRKDSQEVEKKSWTPQINIDMSVLIPESYIKDFDLRLSLYKRASALATEAELVSFSSELVNRFGSLPSELEGLLSIIRLKQLCLATSVTKINLGDKGILVEFIEDKDSKLSEKLVEFVMKNKERVKVKNNNSFVLIAAIKEPEKRIQFTEKFLKSLS